MNPRWSLGFIAATACGPDDPLVKAATAEAPARAPARAEARARENSARSVEASLCGDLLMLQRHAGNLAVGRMLAGVQGGAGERQANSVADAAVAGRRAAPAWLAIGPTAPRDVPASVVDALATQGHALEPGIRAAFEEQIGTALGSVHIHTDSRSAASARDLGAKAYTYGPHVVFAPGRFAPSTTDGRHLLAHELTHVAQQRQTRPVLQLAPVSDAGPATTATPAEDPLKAALLSQLTGLALPPLGIRLAVAAGGGMGEQIVTDLKGDKGVALLAAVRTFRLPDVTQLNGGFSIGLLSGIVSPVTDLFSLAVLGERVRNFLLEVLANPTSTREGLSEDINALLAEVGKLTGAAAESWKEITKSPRDALIFILKLPDQLSKQAERKAYELGKAGGSEIVNSLLQPFGLGTPEKKEEKPSWITRTAGAIEHTFSGAKDWLVGPSPWAKIGEKIGYALGWVAIQVILFVFTDGIGDAIQWLAQGLGKIGKALGTFSEAVGRVAAKVAKTVAEIGEAIAVVEQWFGTILAKLLKPAEKFLEPLLTRLMGVRDKLRVVLGKLLGITRKESTQLAEAAATKGAGAVDEALERAAPAGGPKTTPQPAPTPPEPKPVTKAPPDAPPPGEGAAAERAATKTPEPINEPVEGGHHVQVREDGIGLCSTDPCPLLRVEYKAQLDANEELAKRMAAIEQLRATDPKAAAKAAAELRESLEFIRSHPDFFDALPSHVTHEQQAQLAELLRRAEKAGGKLSEERLRGAAAALGETKDAAEVADVLDGLAAHLDEVPDPLAEAGKVGGGSREGDLARELPEGTHALNLTLKNPKEVSAFLHRYQKVKASPESEAALDGLFQSTKSGAVDRTPWSGRYLPKRTGPAAAEMESIVELSARQEVEAIELVPSSSQGRTADKILDIRQPDGSLRRVRYEDRTITGVATEKGKSAYRPRGTVERGDLTPDEVGRAITDKVTSTPSRPSQFESLMVDAPEGGILGVHIQNPSPTAVQDIDDGMRAAAGALANSRVEAVEFYVPGLDRPLRYVRAPHGTFSLLGAPAAAGGPP
jgi:hypothetical protein